MSFDFINPEELGDPSGWTNGMLAPERGRVLFVAGQVAFGANGRLVRGGVVEQWDQALANVVLVVEAAGGRPDDIGRMTIYVTDLAAYRDARSELGEVWRRRMGRHYPALSVVQVAGLVDDGALVEIEATAVISARPPAEP